VKRLLLCLLLMQPFYAVAQTTDIFPDSTDVLLLSETNSIAIYVEGSRLDSIRELQSRLDELTRAKKAKGVMLRFDPKTVHMKYAMDTSEGIYHCGIPVIYLFDVEKLYSPSEIAADTYLFSLNRMPKYSKFLRILDLNRFILMPSSKPDSANPNLPSAAASVVGSVLILFLAVASYIAGLYISRLKKPWWALGYIVPVLLTALVAIARWFPTLEMKFPFRLLMYDRREYIVMAAATALLLAVPVARLTRKTTAVLATVFASLFVLHFSLLPFILPVFNRAELIGIKTTFDQYGTCMQNTGYTCGPAAAVSALRSLDVSADEGELAVFAHSTSSAGTPPELLCRAVSTLYNKQGVQCKFEAFAALREIRGRLPFIAVIKFGLLVDHYVTVLRVTDDYVTVADPARGLRIMSIPDFESEWRNSGIVLSRN
jgi:predicted double-glycine peptidase